jgi:alkylation response protein AidB-like acyl-CoA dehydrogenase
MAAGYTAEAAVKVTGEDIQLHGGVGFTWANDAHFLFKRAKQNDVLLGGHASQRKRLAAMLLETV